MAAGGGGQLEDNRDVLALGGNVQEVRRAALRRELEGLGDRRLADPVQGGLRLIRDVAHLRLRRLDVPVDVHDAGGALHDGAHLPGELDALGLIGAVDLGDDRL